MSTVLTRKKKRYIKNSSHPPTCFIFTMLLDQQHVLDFVPLTIASALLAIMVRLPSSDHDRSERHVVGWLRDVFLPKGYPDSVSPDYLQYQMWDTIQVRT